MTATKKIDSVTLFLLVNQVASRVATYFSRRVRHADYSDCYQEAAVALYDAAATYDADKAWEPWAMRVASRQVRNYLYSIGSPVSASRSRASKHLLGHRSQTIETLENALSSSAPSAVDQLHRRRGEEAVRAAVAAVCATMRGRRRAATEAVLLRGLAPREAAIEEGLSPDVVSWAVRRARSALKEQYPDILRPYL